MTLSSHTLREQHCRPCHEGMPSLGPDESRPLLAHVPGWILEGTIGFEIYRQFWFEDFIQSMAFANAVARIAQEQDHHPEIVVGFGRCLVRLSTRAVGGVTENDFICAARINALVEP
ncbi:MAG: 4a-hydroxytetrahydrobiopterin dehydratase [Magnetococcales bacterium]|nr:4a-hydroxytetrahydrobiopterin dehydratase [Magnetococcales bacterium]